MHKPAIFVALSTSFMGEQPRRKVALTSAQSPFPGLAPTIIRADNAVDELQSFVSTRPVCRTPMSTGFISIFRSTD